jgi:hypothetical protein
VLGPWVNRAWLNVLASVIVGFLLVLSLVLVVATLIPSIDVSRLFVVLTLVFAGSLAVGGAVIVRGRRRRPDEPASIKGVDRLNWRMPRSPCSGGRAGRGAGWWGCTPCAATWSSPLSC